MKWKEHCLCKFKAGQGELAEMFTAVVIYQYL